MEITVTSLTDDSILYLCQRDVEAACKAIDSVAVIREVFRAHWAGHTILPDEAYLTWINDKGESVRSLNMPSFVGGSLGAAGTKIINGNTANFKRGLSRASGLTLLYANTSVRVRCIMEGAYLSSLRTASVTALAADLLKGNEIECLAIIGAGALAHAHIDLLVTRLSHLRHIRIFDLEAERIAFLQRELAPMLEASEVVLQPTTTAEEAIRGAQLIVPVTTTTTGYIPYEWLQPGSLLVNISLDDPLPEIVFKADKVIVDDWNLVKNDAKRLLGRMYREGKILGPNDPVEGASNDCRRVDAHLGEIVAGAKVGRGKRNEIILVNPFGLSIEDVALAAYVYQAAQDLGIGVLLER
jgi:ornithine cyclodeaminase/alanine dehydrogenase-like protein (mu-crystallin family)